ncbi:MAG: hypothetical protein KTR28_04925 [Micavibrio sp.]|nr:hypothetical protein [Micavibrio sp.]
MAEKLKETLQIGDTGFFLSSRMLPTFGDDPFNILIRDASGAKPGDDQRAAILNALKDPEVNEKVQEYVQGQLKAAAVENAGSQISLDNIKNLNSDLNPWGSMANADSFQKRAASYASEEASIKDQLSIAVASISKIALKNMLDELDPQSMGGRSRETVAKDSISPQDKAAAQIFLEDNDAEVAATVLKNLGVQTKVSEQAAQVTQAAEPLAEEPPVDEPPAEEPPAEEPPAEEPPAEEPPAEEPPAEELQAEELQAGGAKAKSQFEQATKVEKVPDLDTVKRLQAALIKAKPSYEENLKWTDSNGVDQPAVDGKLGSRTRKALKEYATENNLDPEDIKAVINHAESNPAPEEDKPKTEIGKIEEPDGTKSAVEKGELSNSYNNASFEGIQFEKEVTTKVTQERQGKPGQPGYKPREVERNVVDRTDGFDRTSRRSPAAEDWKRVLMDGNKIKGADNIEAAKIGILTLGGDEKIDLTRFNPVEHKFESFNVGEFVSDAANLEGRNWDKLELRLTDKQAEKFGNAFEGMENYTSFDTSKGMVAQTRDGAEIMLSHDDGSVTARLVDDPKDPSVIAARNNTPEFIANMEWGKMSNAAEVIKLATRSNWEPKEDQPNVTDDNPQIKNEDRKLGMITQPADIPKIG